MSNINKLKKITFGALFTLIAVVLSCFVGNFIPENTVGGLYASAATASVAMVDNADSKHNAEKSSANLLDSDIGDHSATYTSYVSIDILNVSNGLITGIKPGYEDQVVGALLITDDMGIVGIGDSAFYGCTQLTHIGIPSTVYHIGDSAFAGCTSLEKVVFAGDEILANVPSAPLVSSSYEQGIGADAFYGCTSLSGVYIQNLESWCDVIFANEEANPLWNAGLLYIGSSSDLVEDLTIPSSVTSISDYAFAGLSVDSVTISYSASSSSIGDYAFYACGMTSISISSSHVSSIGEYAFSGCSQLTSITLPSGVTTIPEGAFSNCEELSSVTLSSDTQTIEYCAFDSCTSLSSITLPSTMLTTIGSYAFTYSGLTSITIPACVTEIGSNPFYGCDKFASFSVNSSNTNYYSEDNCLIKKSTKAVVSGCKNSTIPSDIKIIEGNAFFSCAGLTNISIPNSVTSIGSSAFAYCSNLTSITLSNALTSIGQYAFSNCSKILEYNFSSYSSVPSLGSNAFQNINSSCKIRVPASLYNEWIAKTNWSTYANYIVTDGEVAGLYDESDNLVYTWQQLLDNGKITVTSGSLKGNDSSLAGKLVIDSSVTSIAGSAFRTYKNITGVVIPDSVTSIGSYAFYYCENLTGEISTNSTYIYDDAFSYTAITSLVIGSGVSVVSKANPFEGCDNLASITVDSANQTYYSSNNCIIRKSDNELIVGCKNTIIPNTVITIGEWAFAGCDTLTEINIPNNVTTIEGHAFYSCGTLASVSLGSGLTSIGDYAFTHCFDLKNIAIPNNVTHIGYAAFYHSGLDTVTIGSGLSSVGTFNPFSSFGTPDTITVDSANTVFKVEGGCLIEIATSTLIAGTTGITEIPSGVVNISVGAFYYSPIQSLHFPASVASISEGAFIFTKLTSITVDSANTVYYSQDDCLMESATKKLVLGCTNSIIPSDTIIIGTSAFSEVDDLGSLTIPASVTTIEDDAFWNTECLSYYFLDHTSVPTLGKDAFQGIKNNAKIYVPNNLYSQWVAAENWSTYATNIVFEGSGLYNPDTGELIYSWEELVSNGDVIVSGTRLVTINKVLTGKLVVSGTIVTIGTGAFVDSLLTELELPDSVITIEDDAICYSKSVIGSQLTTLKIGAGIQYVGEMEFSTISYMSGSVEYYELTNLYLADLKAWCEAEKPEMMTIPAMNLYVSGIKVDKLVIPNGTKAINGMAFRGVMAITEVSIPASVEFIGTGAFAETLNNTAFTVDSANTYYSSINGVLFSKDQTVLYSYPLAKGGNVTLPVETTTIEYLAFEYAQDIASITFNSKLERIVAYAFAYINVISGDAININLPDSVISLSIGAFSGAKLNTVHLGSQITVLDYACFSNSTLSSINLENVEELKGFALGYAESLSKISLPAITSIEGYALTLSCDINMSGCSAIPTIEQFGITIPNDCTNKIYVPADLYDEWIVAEIWSNYADYIVLVEEEDPTDSLAGGLYYVETNELIYSWEDLITEGLVEVSDTTLTGVQGGDGEGEYLLVIPEGITEIAQMVGAQNFVLGGLRLPSTLETVGMAAFAYTAIREINIPAACVSIGDYAFAASLACTAINVAATNPAYASVNGALFNKDKTILMVFPAGKSGSYTIPDTCQTIFDGAFSMSSLLTSVTIPNSVTTIGMGAFAQSGISGKLVLPNSLTTITQNAFYGCANIEEIVLGSSVASIGEESFSGCESLTTISWTTSLTSLGTNAFSGCYSLTGTIDIPNVTSIPTKAFYDLPLVTAVNFSDRLTDIGESAFENCSSLTGSLVIPDSCTSISQAAFRNTGFTSVTISSGMQSISNYTFQNCTSLTTINWNSNLTDIGVAAFAGCSALAGKITIPSGVTILNSYVFQDCSSITGLNLHDSITQIGDLAFYNCTNITGSLTLPSNLTTIGQSAFRNCGKITGTLTIPSKVTSIGIYAFRDCIGLTTANIGNAVVTIAEQAFYNCSGLTKVTIGNAVQTIGNNAFENCSALASLTMGTSVQTIGERAFYGCTNLAGSLSLPSTLVDVGQSAFRDCKKLTGTLTFGNNVTSIGAYAFQNCSGFTGLVIGTNVETVGDLAFYNCTGLTSFSFNSTKITSIGTSAFRNLTKITGTITFPDTLTTIGDFAFHSATGITKFTFGANISSLGAGAFANCTGVTIYDFSTAANVPTLNNTNCFNGITTGVKIGVPGSLYSSWKVAENWSNYADYIVVLGSKTVNYSLMYDPSHGTDVYIVKNGTQYRGTGSFTVNSGDVITVYMTDVYAVSGAIISGFEVSQGSYSTFQTNSSGYKRDIDLTLDTNLILYNASSTLTIKTYVSNSGTKTYGTIVPMYRISYTLYYPETCSYVADNTTEDYTKTVFKLYFGENVLASAHSTNTTVTGTIAINSDIGLYLQIQNGYEDDYTMRFLCVGFEISISGASATYVNLTTLGNWTDSGYNFTTDKGQISGLNSSCTITIKTCTSSFDDMSGATVYSGAQIVDDNDLPSTVLPTSIVIEGRQIIDTLETAEVVIGEDQKATSAKVWLDDKFRKVQEQQTTNVDFDGVTFDA